MKTENRYVILNRSTDSFGTLHVTLYDFKNSSELKLYFDEGSHYELNAYLKEIL